MFQDIVPIVRHHHEHIDGTGYPDGLKGTEIELFARIISVADAFDAMMSDRHYRKHLTLEETRRQLTRCVRRRIGGFRAIRSISFRSAVRVTTDALKMSARRGLYRAAQARA